MALKGSDTGGETGRTPVPPISPGEAMEDVSGYWGTERIIQAKLEYLMPCSFHFYRNPPQIVSGAGAFLRDSEGREYADFFAGVTVMNCGHANEAINGPAIQQIRTLQHTSSIYLTQPVVELAERLAEVLPGDLTRSFFCNSGSEANEGAMLLARLATGRREFVALSRGLHGRTCLSSAANGIPMWRTDPYLDEMPVRIAADTDDLCRILEEEGERIAAVIAEPIQGNGGIYPLPPDFFVRTAPLMRDKGVLFIADEVQTGFARTGRMFAIEHYAFVPDILTGAKALGNGFPIGFFAASDRVASALNRPSASTLGGNPVSCTAALAVLDYIRDQNLVKAAADKGARLKAGLERIALAHVGLGAVRGMGLMLGLPLVEMEGEDLQGACAAQRTDQVLEAMKDRGFLIGKNGLGRNVLAFQPPLVIEERTIDAMLMHLDRVMDEVL